MSDRLPKVFEDAVDRVRERKRKYGLLGRHNADDTVTFAVPGRRNYLYVTIRNANGAQTVVPARNDAGVPHSPDLPVEMRVENKTTFVITGRTSREDLATVPASPASGVPTHTHEHVDLGSLDADDHTQYHTDARGDARYAPLAEGVTGGDAHDHVGGDGGTIAYSSLSGTPAAYSDEEAQDAVGAMLVDSATIDFTYTDATPALTAIVIDASITNAKLAVVATNTIKGRSVAGTGAPTDLAAASVRSIIGVGAGADETSSSLTGLAAKVTPVDADHVIITDSAASNVGKKTTWANIKATLKTYLDTLYAALVHTHHTTSTWTPTITGSVSNPTTLTFFAQEGRYSQDGDRVYFTFRLSIDSISGGSGDARISLPVTAAALGAVNDARCAMSMSGVPVTAGAFGLNFRVQNGAAYGIAQHSISNSTIVSTQIADLATTDVLAATGFYYV